MIILTSTLAIASFKIEQRELSPRARSIISWPVLKKFGLTDCNGVDKPIASRLTVQDQQEVPNSTAQKLYSGMVGSLLYLA